MSLGDCLDRVLLFVVCLCDCLWFGGVVVIWCGAAGSCDSFVVWWLFVGHVLVVFGLFC